MKILFVSPYLPSRQSGSPVRLRGLMTRLARSHSVSIIALTRPVEDQEIVADVASFCDDVVMIPNDRFGLSPSGNGGPLQLRACDPSATAQTLAWWPHAACAAMTCASGVPLSSMAVMVTVAPP